MVNAYTAQINLSTEIHPRPFISTVTRHMTVDDPGRSLAGHPEDQYPSSPGPIIFLIIYTCSIYNGKTADRDRTLVVYNLNSASGIVCINDRGIYVISVPGDHLQAAQDDILAVEANIFVVPAWIHQHSVCVSGSVDRCLDRGVGLRTVQGHGQNGGVGANTQNQQTE